MENPSRSSRRKKPGKPSQADDAAKGIYDGVFGGQTKCGFPTSLSPRAEDYREVFGGYHAPRVSSIPVLDLQAVDEQVCFDVRKRGFDYSEVFGVFQSLDFADGTAAAFGSPSEELDHPVSNHCLSNGDSDHLSGENIEYNISYDKANPEGDIEISSDLRRTAEIQAVPGNSNMVDCISPSQMKEKHLKNTMLDNSNCRNDVRCQRDHRITNSCPGETLMMISGVSRRTEPSCLLPPSRLPLAASLGDKNGPTWSCKTSYADDNNTFSPSFFNVEVDAISSAAAVASAAAMEEAIRKARAQLMSARELMDRKKGSRQNHVRLGSGGELSDIGGKNLNEEIAQGTSPGIDGEMKSFIVEEPQDI